MHCNVWGSFQPRWQKCSKMKLCCSPPINVFCSRSCYLLQKHFSDENFPWWTGWHLTHHNFCPQGFKVSWKIILMDRYHWLRQELPTHWCARPPDFWFFTQLNITTQCHKCCPKSLPHDQYNSVQLTDPCPQLCYRYVNTLELRLNSSVD